MTFLYFMACVTELKFQNFPPQIELLSPTDSVFQEGQGIPFTVYAFDPEGEGITVTFQSDADGIFFEGVPDSEGQIQINPTGLSVGFHRILIVATDTEGQQADWSLELSINGQPDSPALLITPDAPTTKDDLTLTITEGLDPEGDTITHSILWKQNGAVIDDLTDSPTVTADYTNQGDVWQVTVTPDDGQVTGQPETTSVEIQDSPPSITEVSIAPNSEVTTRTELLCEAIAEDIDGETPTLTYRWRRVINDIASEITIEGEVLALTSAISQPNDKYLCEVEAESNGLLHQDSEIVQITNSMPTISNTEIVSYGPIRAGESVFCNADVNDIDEIDVTSSTEWRLNGNQILGLEYTLTLPENGVRAGDTLSCIISAQDSHGGEVNDTVDVSIENTPPVMDSIGLTPSYPKTTDSISCNATASDIDQDIIGLSYLWTVNGVIDTTQTTNTFTGALSVNDVVRCEVTPNDGTEDGNSALMDATVINTPPSIQTLSLNPSEVTTTDNLIAIVSASDIDGDSVTIGYAWYVNGNVVQQGSDSSLNGNYFEVGDEITVYATPYDGRDYGSVQQSDTIDVLNTPPVIEQHVLFSEDPIRRGATVFCNANIDDDDSSQILSIDYLWQDQSGTVLSTTDSLAIDENSGLLFEDELSCTITVDDGQESTTSTASTSIANSPPTIVTVGVTPEPAFSQDELTCTAVAQDIDEQSLTTTYQWAINGIGVSETSSSFSHSFEPNDIVTCFVQASDGIDESVFSPASKTIQNQTPVVESVSLFPLTAYANSTFQAIVDATDADGHSLEYAYTWRVNGNIVQQNASGSLTSSLLLAGDQVEVRVRADDSYSISTPGTSNTVTILNAQPTNLTIRINPAEAIPNSGPLICEVLTPAVDIDGDSLSYSVNWMRNGAPYVGGGAVTRTTVYPGDTIPVNALENGDVWVCEFTVTDNITPPVAETAQATVDCGLENSPSCPGLSCKDLLDNDPSLYGLDGVYYVKPDLDTYTAYCDMTYDGGGWSLLMTSYIEGNSPYGFFRYDDNISWETDATLNTEFLSSNKAASEPEFSKYDTYSEVDGESLRLNVNWAVIDFNLFYDGMAGQTALDVFSGPEILIQGDMSLACHGELLSSLEVADFIPIGQGPQGFGINLVRTPETGSSAKVRFGIIHNSSSSSATDERTIGLGALTYSSRLGFKDPPSNCGNSGNSVGFNQPVLMDLWIR